MISFCSMGSIFMTVYSTKSLEVHKLYRNTFNNKYISKKKISTRFITKIAKCSVMSESVSDTYLIIEKQIF